MSEPLDCVIVGAGIAGLACAGELGRRGRRVIVLEATDRVGGRVATDTVEGFRIDRGFQVYNDAYPEGRRQLDLESLALGRFEPGALIASGGRLMRVSDPWRRPLAAVGSLLSGAVGLGDALRTARLRGDAIRGVRSGAIDPEAPPRDRERTTREELASRGFSEAFVRRFFVPFFGGVFLERSLDTAAAVFLFDFAMFSLGRACLPAGGMDAMPRQLAARLPEGSVRLGTRVRSIEPGRVTLDDGSTLVPRDVIVATDGPAAGQILPEGLRGSVADRTWKSTRLVAFAADRSPLASRTLVVSAEDDGPIDNLTVPTDVAAGYAPPGRSLVTVSVRDGVATGDVAEAVKQQAAGWFGGQVEGWRYLATVEVPRALPDESPPARQARATEPRLATGLWICGDHCAAASINGALGSGRRCGEAVLAAG
ncbi:MAG: NAD(P)/FAD-dependent oxidoreductase [Planctomycetaceae bacterium]